MSLLKLSDTRSTPPNDRRCSNPQVHGLSDLSSLQFHLSRHGLAEEHLSLPHRLRLTTDLKGSLAVRQGVADLDEGARAVLDAAEVGAALAEHSADAGLLDLDGGSLAVSSPLGDEGLGFCDGLPGPADAQGGAALVDVELGTRLVLEGTYLGITLAVDRHDHGSGSEIHDVLGFAEDCVATHGGGALDSLLGWSGDHDLPPLNAGINLGLGSGLDVLNRLAPPSDDGLHSLAVVDLIAAEGGAVRRRLAPLLLGRIDEGLDLLVREGDLVLVARDLEPSVAGAADSLLNV
mmetsp:Transcript_17156/g.35229  ORF Transcript_17156/g.35229 Transcript_17156/m.35229 type:complete len:291 (+) Transcript_17156:734-1606(+)